MSGSSINSAKSDDEDTSKQSTPKEDPPKEDTPKTQEQTVES